LGTVQDKLQNLKPVQYKILPTFEGDAKADSVLSVRSNEQHIGFIAQDLMEVFPELVSKDEKGILCVKYLELIPVLVKSIQEQNAQIADLKKRIAILENK
jgi:hypothetical protein